jgi:hypothetical protein
VTFSWFGYLTKIATKDEGGKLACLAQVSYPKLLFEFDREIIGTFVLIFLFYLQRTRCMVAVAAE